jgi:hypothetical protein
VRTAPFLADLLARRLPGAALDWVNTASAEIAGGVDDQRFAALLSLASRHARRAPLAPSAEERAQAERLLPGFDPERWTLQETARVALVLARPDMAGDSGARAVEEAFRYADEGELCALYRSLAHLPAPERFAWRAGEGCRTNMATVFEANALDTPLPAAVFDDLAFRQAVIKCVFVGAPLWRLHGLDRRLSAELARMALDLADERRSAGRPVPHELWLALGKGGGERGLQSLERELAGTNTLGRRAAAYGLARAGAVERLERHLASERDPSVAAAMRDALSGNTAQAAFRALDPR